MPGITMLATTAVTAAITRLIAAGVAEEELVARVVRQFPQLTTAELSQALQVATTAAERQAVRANH
jgi:uncharacterized protein (DUF433 family)